MMSPFRTPSPRDNSAELAELAEIEEWLVTGRYQTTVTPKRWPLYVFLGVLLALIAGSIAGFALAQGVLAYLAIILVPAFAVGNSYVQRRIARRNMRRAGLLPPER